MALPVKSDTELINDQANAMQAAANQATVNTVLDFSEGAVLRAIIESNMGNSLWLQALISAELSVTRLATSKGNDVDTFLDDFGQKRVKATPTTGPAVFSRSTPNMAALVEVGTIVSAIVNGVSYMVIADTTNSAFDPVQNGYVVPIGTYSVTAPVIAQTSGVIGNILANQLVTINTPIFYIDSVTNTQPFTNGTDAQSDQAAQASFPLYLASLNRAVKQSIEYAAQSVPGVKRYFVKGNKNLDGSDHLGFFYVVIDDGTGNASSPLLGNVSAAVDVYAGLTIAYSVYPPTPYPISIVLNITTDGTTPDGTVITAVQTALASYISSLTFNSLFAYSRIPFIAYSADSSITDITDYTLNGGTSDIQISGQQIMTVGTITPTIVTLRRAKNA